MRFIFLTLLSVCLPILSAEAQRRPAKPTPPPKIKLPASVRSVPRSVMDVAKVKPSTRSRLVGSAFEIDQLVEDQLRAKDLRPNEMASDEVFLRRIYLDVAGRIPTLKEAKDFLDSAEENKRQDLIDRLLESPDYVSNMYNFWADTLRLTDRPQANIIADPYLSYVKDSIRINKPYDEWVFEMLTANGKVWEDGAVGYQLRDDGMPLPYIDNTVRVFLGTQIGCAQCHDHPFDDWTQYQFYQLAAFTNGTRTRMLKGYPGFEKTNPANALINEARTKFDKGRVPGNFQRLVRANTYVVSEVKATMRLPHDYAYADHDPKEVVQPAVLWGEIPTKAADSTPREQFAAWLTSDQNEQFSKTIANRLWKRFMGVGLVEPIDDFQDIYPPSNEALMDFLSEEIVRNDFDLKEFMRSIFYSRTYQREASDYDPTSNDKYHYPGPAVRRMTAEQVWDSILTLAVQNPWPFQRPNIGELASALDVNFAQDNYNRVLQKSENFKDTYFAGTYKRNLNAHAYQGNILCRASELPSPLPPQHFLRQFGQGDRETINGSQEDATVPQILAMFNGPITHVMLEPGSAIVDNVLGIESTRDRVDAIFLSVLTREPTGADRRIAAGELQKTRADNVGYGNIVWGLLNTREFLFIP
ncbi:MAG: DUF1549 and DUF1553 domain-containing protein [Rubripirellula sp.]|nr:DUF1549 and DUF1553 domain-containing protein [Rubripirellula sp.]